MGAKISGTDKETGGLSYVNMERVDNVAGNVIKNVIANIDDDIGLKLLIEI